ncbi:MAG: RCC1 domain-containing protein [Candidatus Limnocylindrus sp.]
MLHQPALRALLLAASLAVAMFAPSATRAADYGESIDTGFNFTCASRADGYVWCWGDNSFGQLGNGTFANSKIPVRIEGFRGVIQVATGATHACALRYNGTVWCWGNYLPDGSTATTPTKVSKLKAVRTITAGSSHSCALKANGTVWCWGDNASGQLGNGTTTDKRVPVRVTGLSAVRSISAGQSHTCAVTWATLPGTAAKAWCWGENGSGQLGDFTSVDRTTPVQVTGMPASSEGTALVGISVGTVHSCAYDLTYMYCWGTNSQGQLGYVGNSFLAKKVVGIGGVLNMDVGSLHSCSVDWDGTVECWGNNSMGELADGTTVSKSSPTVADLEARVKVVSAGNKHTCVLTMSGDVYCAGWNASGQIGNNSLATSWTVFKLVEFGDD